MLQINYKHTGNLNYMYLFAPQFAWLALTHFLAYQSFNPFSTRPHQNAF